MRRATAQASVARCLAVSWPLAGSKVRCLCCHQHSTRQQEKRAALLSAAQRPTHKVAVHGTPAWASCYTLSKKSPPSSRRYRGAASVGRRTAILSVHLTVLAGWQQHNTRGTQTGHRSGPEGLHRTCPLRYAMFLACWLPTQFAQEGLPAQEKPRSHLASYPVAPRPYTSASPGCGIHSPGETLPVLDIHLLVAAWARQSTGRAHVKATLPGPASHVSFPLRHDTP